MDNTYKVNRFDIPLLQINSVTSLYNTFSVAFSVASKDDTDSFEWQLQELREVANRAGIASPGVVITDFDNAIKNALETTFPEAQQQICTWHIAKNVLHNLKEKWLGGDALGLPDEEDVGEEAPLEPDEPPPHQPRRPRNSHSSNRRATPRSHRQARRIQTHLSAPEETQQREEEASQAAGSSTYDALTLFSEWQDLVQNTIIEDEFLNNWEKLVSKWLDQPSE